MNKYIFGSLALLLLVGGGCKSASQTTLEAEHEGETEDHELSDDSSTVSATVDASVESTTQTSLGQIVLPANVVFSVSGSNFAFDKSRLEVNEGDTVTINFTSASGFHDWVVDEFDAKTAQVSDGNSTQVTFVADKAGEFEYYCSVGEHRKMGMVGKLIVKKRAVEADVSVDVEVEGSVEGNTGLLD